MLVVCDLFKKGTCRATKQPKTDMKLVCPCPIGFVDGHGSYLLTLIVSGSIKTFQTVTRMHRKQ